MERPTSPHAAPVAPPPDTAAPAAPSGLCPAPACGAEHGNGSWVAHGDAPGHGERHAHHHAHGPIHAHVHGADTVGYGRRFAFGVALNLGFVAVEAVSGWLSGSLALLADAGHNLSDVVGLLLAWGAYAAARLRPNDRHTYGWRRGSILAGFVNAVVLLVAMGWLWWEAGTRLLRAAAAPAPGIVIAVAALGVLINGLTAALFLAGGRRDLNLRGAFLHMAADALISLGVVLAGVLTWWSGWGWIDPAVSLVIAGVIMAGTLPLARQTLHLLFDGVPAGVELSTVRQALLQLPGVASVHDLHVWALGTGGTDDVALTAHLVLGPNAPSAETVLAEAARALRAQGVGHTTLQIETTACGAGCATAAVGSDAVAHHAGAGAA